MCEGLAIDVLIARLERLDKKTYTDESGRDGTSGQKWAGLRRREGALRTICCVASFGPRGRASQCRVSTFAEALPRTADVTTHYALLDLDFCGLLCYAENVVKNVQSEWREGSTRH